MHHSNPVPLHFPSSAFPSPAIDPSSLKRHSPPSPTMPSSSSRPAKRSRKAINCEPCRASKLKCDRGRPCSGCVLRGTVSSCYADHPSEDGGPSTSGRSEEYAINPRIDPKAEITRIRNSLLVIEHHINRGIPNPATSANGNPNTGSHTYHHESRRSSFNHSHSVSSSGSEGSPDPLPATVQLKLPSDPSPDLGEAFADGAQGFIGATSISCSLRLLSLRDRDASHETDSDNASDCGAEACPASSAIDDLLAALPDPLEIEGTIAQHFSRFAPFPAVHRETFAPAWERFKTNTTQTASQGQNRLAQQYIVLSTVFAILAISLQQHATHSSTQSDLAHHYFSFSELAYSRIPTSSGGSLAVSLDQLELLLLHVQYFENQSEWEKIWGVRAQAVAVALSLGLHRDPARWPSMPAAEKERRRCAWWSVLWVDRWYAFYLGRPPSVQNAHFDTCFPSSSSSAASSPIHSPQITFSFNHHLNTFRLAHLLGTILDDFASASGAITHERVWAHDRVLQGILDASSVVGVEGALGRATLLHVRIALHRAIVVSATTTATTVAAKSLEVAVRSAESLIGIYLSQSNTSPSPIKSSPTGTTPSIPPTCLTTHTFSATLFLASILIQPPPSCPSHSIRHTVRVALQAFGFLKSRATERAWRILSALRPLWEEGGVILERNQREEIWRKVRKLSGSAADSMQTHDLFPSTFPSPQQNSSPGSSGSSNGLMSRSGTSSASPATSLSSTGSMPSGTPGMTMGMTSSTSAGISSDNTIILGSPPGSRNQTTSYTPVLSLPPQNAMLLAPSTSTTAAAFTPSAEDYFDMSSYEWPASLGLYSSGTPTQHPGASISPSPADWASIAGVVLNRPSRTGSYLG